MHPMHLPMKVLIACEFSGVVRRAFDRLGHDVWSCDLRRSDDNSNRHIVGNVLDILDWDTEWRRNVANFQTTLGFDAWKASHQ